MSDKPGFSILFVCTGNTCRSPMAQAMLQARLTGGLRERVRVSSAGTHAHPGMPASANTVAALVRAGIVPGGHRSRPLTREILAESDLVLAIAPEHREWIVELSPEAAGKTFVLSSFAADKTATGDLAVHDPIGGSLEIYEETYRRIGVHLDRILPRILERVKVP
jgi:protein arginine phosphatase